jgi:hypothetical protein
MSRIGHTFCAIYAPIIAACWAFALSAGGDSKGQFVFLQLPIALQGALLHELGLQALLERMNWIVVYLLLGLPTFALLYLARWLIDRLSFNKSFNRDA